MEQSIEAIISAPVGQLNLSKECMAYLKEEGLISIKDFIEAGWTGQKEKESFKVKYFNEVISRLREKDLLYLMEGK